MAALRAAYPSAESIPLVEALSDDLQFFSKAQTSRVFVGVSGRDPIFFLQNLLLLGEEQKRAINGIILQSEIERNCISCRRDIGAAHDKKLQAEIGAERSVFCGAGCEICKNKGVLGEFSLSSVVALTGSVRELFLDDAPLSDILVQLRLDGFYLPYEYALRALRLGECSEEGLLRRLSRPPAPYNVRVPERDVCALDDGAERSNESGRFVLSDEFFSADSDEVEKPLRGAEVYTSRRNSPRFPGKLQNFSSMREVIPTPQSECKILVIDDDPDQRSILSKVLEMAGYTVQTAADGIDGVVSASRSAPNVVLVDLMLPDIDGKETIRRLRKNPSTMKVPIIALTAHPDPEVEFDLLDAGADDFCAKSVSKRVLLKRIERLRNRVQQP